MTILVTVVLPVTFKPDPTSATPVVLNVAVFVCPLLTMFVTVVFPVTVKPDPTFATPAVLNVADWT